MPRLKKNLKKLMLRVMQWSFPSLVEKKIKTTLKENLLMFSLGHLVSNIHNLIIVH